MSLTVPVSLLKGAARRRLGRRICGLYSRVAALRVVDGRATGQGAECYSTGAPYAQNRNSISVAEHVVMMILSLVRNYLPSITWHLTD
jgi:hypothetical protein